MSEGRIPFKLPMRIVLRGMGGSPGPGGADIRSAELDIEALIHGLRDAATHAWKANARLRKLQAMGASAEVERLARPIEAILDSLKRAGIEIKDHTGESFDYGQPLKVVASQEREGISHEVVAETIRPSLFLKGEIIQQGEVIIDIPAIKVGE